MKILIFGASGMVGQGVLRECLLDPEVTDVWVVGRSSVGQTHLKLHEILHKDLMNLAPIENQLKGFDAAFFCLGVSAVGMNEVDYRRVTYDLTLSVAQTLARLNPQMTFTYVTGQGTDSSEKGRIMWARVKGQTENALLKLPFKAAVMFRPALIQPLHGIRSKTFVYQSFYTLTRPFIGLLTKYFPAFATTTEQLGRAMIQVAKTGSPQAILESRDINLI